MFLKPDAGNLEPLQVVGWVAGPHLCSCLRPVPGLPGNHEVNFLMPSRAAVL